MKARDFLGGNYSYYMAQARFHLHVYGFDKQDAFKDEVIYAEVAREWFNAYLSFGLQGDCFNPTIYGSRL
jgi:hypothetical protein